MIEQYENILQISVLFLCSIVALRRALRERSRTWGFTFFFFISWLMGDVYWVACLVFYGDTPQVSVVSDLSWYASLIFLYLLLQQTTGPDIKAKWSLIPWIGPVFATAMGTFFVRWGNIISNVVYEFLMTFLLYSVIARLVDLKQYRKQLFLCVLILVFLMLVYAMWTASCFWYEESISNPYYWFDTLLTLSFPFFIPAAGKADAT
ncbi:MAG: hypothetical protein IK016_04475 [Lachnospiraceae bacterium]|nr:hypothetical protein [Lachnospiraceae bacterium]